MVCSGEMNLTRSSLTTFKQQNQWRACIRLFFLLCLVALPYYLVKKNWMESKDATYLLVTEEADIWCFGMSTMRAALSPEHFQEAGGFDGKGLNLAISGGTTPHGPFYTEFLKSKIKRRHESEPQQIFLVEWKPSSFDSPHKVEQNFRESDELIYKMFLLNANPNWEFILRRKHEGKSILLELLFPGKDPHIVHKNGWKERPPREKPLSQEEIAVRAERLNRRRTGHSSIRMNSFFELLDYLTACGRVIVLATPSPQAEWQVPIPEEFLRAENMLRKREDLVFLDFSQWAQSEDFEDYNHLHRDAAIRFSLEVGALARERLLAKPH